MGLLSGNRWAVSNLDATGPYFFQESPFQYECSFFSWGNVTPHNPISETEFGYNFGSINSAAPYYEGQPYGETPGSMLTGNIPLDHDAARRLLAGPWRIPTRTDFIELLAGCEYIDGNGEVIPTEVANKITTVNGVVGLRLRSKVNGNELFLPSSGTGDGLTLNGRNSSTFYWTVSYANIRGCWSLWLRTGYSPSTASYQRYHGCPIRPIWNPRDLRG